ncbi:MAG: hypothetical protein FJ286_16630 [Planctomycetes bacterium]|nr:hypothetical protein [Planctomycetota bacterium]
MNYNRYLDIHLCTSYNISGLEQKYPPMTAVQQPNGQEVNIATGMYFGRNGQTYFYQFNRDVLKQRKYRESKTEGFTFNEKNTGNCRILTEVELTEAGDGFLRVIANLDTTGGGSGTRSPGRSAYGSSTAASRPQAGRKYLSIREELKQLRYVGCMVSIEHLQTTEVYEQLQALMLWISDPTTVNKLRINCHGAGTSTGVMTMGQGKLSAKELVEALVRHGLTRPSTRHGSSNTGLAQNARWKLDSEKAACEACSKKFGPFTRRHHCRRCGGLFCDACSSNKVNLEIALTGETQTATALNVKKARVCNPCNNALAMAPAARALAEDAVLGEVFGKSVAAQGGELALTNYGLKTICLALCMGAKADDKFSQERPQQGSFERDSLAGKVIAELRNNNLRGIKVTASNQVVASTEDGIEAWCGVNVPTATGGENTVRSNKFAKGKGTFSIPAYVWGERKPGPVDGLAMFSGDITVSLDRRSLFFGKCKTAANLQTVKTKYLDDWKFTSWHKKQSTEREQPAGAVYHTWRLTAPPRVTSITSVAAGGGNNTITITGRETEYFKDYKSYEES